VPGHSPRPAELIGLGSTIFVLVVGFTLLGWYADGHLRTYPALVFTGLAVGIVTACVVAYSQFRKFL
jgi:putative F0F1-ATPase subunit (Ca2+/Mg2+ transporter)